jgi:hypothetical protein
VIPEQWALYYYIVFLFFLANCYELRSMNLVGKLELVTSPPNVTLWQVNKLGIACQQHLRCNVDLAIACGNCQAKFRRVRFGNKAMQTRLLSKACCNVISFFEGGGGGGLGEAVVTRSHAAHAHIEVACVCFRWEFVMIDLLHVTTHLINPQPSNFMPRLLFGFQRRTAEYVHLTLLTAHNFLKTLRWGELRH